jgi:predicted ATPase
MSRQKPGTKTPKRAENRIMITSLHIKNFRCFRDLNLDGLKRFNMIVGESASGKTALLESIFLVSAANPVVWLRMRQWRGMSQLIRLTGTRASYESIFRDLFYNFESDRGASINISDDELGKRILRVNYAGKQTYRLPAKGQFENAFGVEPIVFNWQLKNRTFKSKVSVSTKDGSLSFEGANEVYPAWYSSPAIQESANLAQMYSDLSQKNRTGHVTNAVRAIFPFIDDMSLESVAGDLGICVSMSGIDEKMPLQAISGGLSRFLSLAIAIAYNEGGVVLIDEFESGFYYANLSSILESICSFCEEKRVQVFATTHSYEFLQALLPVMTKRRGTPNEFSLLRAVRGRKECSVEVIGEPSPAIENSLEVR